MGKIIFITENEKVLCNLQQCMDDCDNEETDTRLAVHLKDSLVRGYEHDILTFATYTSCCSLALVFNC